MKFTRDYSAEIDRLNKEIQTADAIVIGSAVVKLPTAEVENFVSSVKSALTKI